MKKILFLIVIAAVLLPAAAFAQNPSDAEVQETASAVMASFGIVFLSSMFGEPPEGVQVDMDMTTGKSSMIFDNFNAAEYINSFGDTDPDAEYEMPDFYFETMSGNITVDENGNMNLDVKLKGGNISTLKMQTDDEDLVLLTANGKDFGYLKDFMEE